MRAWKQAVRLTSSLGAEDEFGKNTIRFDTGDDGAVNAMMVDSVTKFRRKQNGSD